MATGLGNPRNSVQQWNSAALQISALRCQGLLRAIPSSIFRQTNSVHYLSAAQPCAEIHNVKLWKGFSRRTRNGTRLWSHSSDEWGTGEESKAWLSSRGLSWALWKLQLHVRAEDAKDLKKQAKGKRKRKRKEQMM